MYECLMVLIDESAVLLKAQALHMLALQMAHTEARYRGLSSVADNRAYTDYVLPRCDELEAKLRQAIPISVA